MFVQFKMEDSSVNTSSIGSSGVAPVSVEKHVKRVYQTKPKKPTPARDTEPKDIDSDDSKDHGCLAILKKLSCTLQCGGTTCSVKETEHNSLSPSPTSSLASPSSSSSYESLALDQKKKRKPSGRGRKRQPQAPVVDNNNDVVMLAPVTSVKKARRSSSKNVPKAC